MGDIMKESKNIPEIRFKEFEGEWEEEELGKLTDVYDGTHQTPKYLDKGVMFLSVENINTLKSEKYISIEDFKKDFKTYPQKGDVLMTRIGDVGTANIVESNELLAYYVSLALLKHKLLNPYFLKACLSSITVVNDIWHRTLHIAFPKKINMYEINKIIVPYPKSKKEQSQIGSYFQNLDQQITLEQQKHDKLVTLKKAMLEKMFPKEGASVPEIRFEGFEGEWEEKKLVDIGYTYTGLSGKNKTDFGHGKGRYVTYMNVFSNTIAKKENTEAIEVDHSQNNVQFGDVFFTTSSETPEEVGMSSVWLADCQDTYLNSFCFGYRPVIKVDNYYFAYLLRSTVIRKKIIFLAQGISRYNISKNKVMEISVPLPTIEEQSQIGSYFQNLDKLISLQQQKIDKLKNIKKACLDKMFV